MIEQNAPTPSAPSTPAPPSTPPAAAPANTGPMTALSLAQMLKAGTINTQRVGVLAKSGNIDLLEVARAHSTLNNMEAEPLVVDTRSPEVKVLDQHFPAAKLDEYVIRYGLPDGEPMSEEMKIFDSSARTWLSGAEFPREVGNSLVNEIDRVTQHTKDMNADQLESYGQSEFSKLQRVFGPSLEEKLNQAGRMIHELDKAKPGLKQLLKSRGIGDSALIASMLIQQSARYWARRMK